MFCPRCQTELRDSQRFCSRCGFDLAGERPIQEGPAPYRGHPPIRDQAAVMPQEGQSGLGIASFVVSLVAVLFIIVAFAIVARAVETLRWSMSDASTLRTVWILAGLSSLAGLGLGIAGIVQKLRKRGLAIAGTVISGLVLLVFIFAWV